MSALVRSGDWSTRLSTGTGFFGPTPLTEEAEAAGLTRLAVDGPLRAERGRSVSIDLTRNLGPTAYTATVFGSRIVDPVHVDRSTYAMRNLESPDHECRAGAARNIPPTAARPHRQLHLRAIT